jgi:PAS domain S-box-containing protein
MDQAHTDDGARNAAPGASNAGGSVEGNAPPRRAKAGEIVLFAGLGAGIGLAALSASGAMGWAGVAGWMGGALAGATGVLLALRRRGAGSSGEDRGKVEATLREGEERYRLALQSVAGVVYEWDVARDRVTRSGGMQELLGYAQGDVALTLEGWMSLVHPEDAAVVSRRMEGATATADRFDVEYRVRHRDGHYVEVWDRGSIQRGPDGRVTRVVGCTMSLAGQRRAEEAAREASSRFDVFADATNDVLWTVEVAPYRVTYLNKAFERVWRIDRAVVYAQPEAWLERIHPEDRARVAEASRVWMDPGAPRTRKMEYRIRHEDGEIRWIQDTAVRLDGEDGRCERVVGVAEDITERKCAELALAEREHEFRELFDASPAVKVIYDPSDGRVLQANEAAAAFYGYSVAEMVAMTVGGLWGSAPGGPPGGARGGSQVAAQGGAAREWYEARHRQRSGGWRDVEVHTSTVQRGGRPLVYALVHDITERKHAEAELRESRRTLEQAQAVGRIGTWVSGIGADAGLLWSSQVFRIFGVSPEEFDQRASTFFSMVHPDDRDAVRASVEEAIRARTVYRIDHRIVRPDGEVRWVLEQGEVEYAPDGRAERVVGVVQDITERRAAEQALRDSQEQLRTTLDNLAEGCLVHGLDGEIVMCNPAAEEILGAPREDLLRRSSADRTWQTLREDGRPMPPEEYPSNISLRTGRPIEGVMIGLGTDTSNAKWISVNSRPLRTAEGRLVGAVVSFSDVTERRAAALALRQTADRYQMLFDANPEPLWVYDSRTLEFLAVNRAAVETYGYTREEFLGMTILVVRPETERGAVLRHVRTASSDERARGVWVHRVRSGRLIDVEVISHVITFEGRPARIALLKDITERLGAERALRESEARLREAQRIGMVGDWEYDPASGRITWSDEVFRLYRRDPALGTPDFGQNRAQYAPEDGARLAEGVRLALEEGRESSLDMRVPFADGSTAWHRGIIRVVRDAQGRVVRLRGVVQDITERKLAEDALRATQMRLATILEHLPDVVVYQAHGDRMLPSENMQSLLGYPAGAFEHDRAAFLRLLHPGDSAEAAGRVRAFEADPAAGVLTLQYRVRHQGGHYVWIEDRMILERSLNGTASVLGVLIDVTERKRFEQRQRLMMAELDHRVKNNLATVMSLLDQTGRTARTLAEFRSAFQGRLLALARMHKALSRTHWEGVDLRTLVSQTLEAYQSNPPGRITVEGEEVILPARTVSPVAMALHELATNAVKYGSLSVAAGCVGVRWDVRPDGEGVPVLHLRWEESRGPAVRTPATTGFGSELIQGGIAYELHGEARIEYDPAGVRCEMQIPLSAPGPILPVLPDIT